MEKIGKYKVVRLIGEGAMGKVYEAIDEAIERRIAIKVLHSQILSQKNGDEFLKRFQREAKLAAQCMHPNIVAVLEYGQHESAPFLAMEYVDGIPLDEIIKDNKKLSVKNIMLIMSQLLKALHAAHSNGIIHRDIKPANIIVLNNGDIKLADFGVARMPTDSELTQVGAVIGTPRFMAPEQTLGMEVDHRIDLFALTVVFMDLLALLDEKNNVPMDFLQTISGLPPSNFINYKQQYPVAFLSVLQQGLAASADDRISSAKEYAQILKTVLPLLKSDDLMPTSSSVKTGIHLQDEEIKSMESLLSSYIGPIAKKLVETQQSHVSGIKEFAQRLADEIPNEKERKEFLQRWETYLKTAMNSQIKNVVPSAGVAEGTVIAQPAMRGEKIMNKPLMPEKQLEMMEQDFAVFVGPMAGRLMKYNLNKCSSISELVYLLAEDIPNEEERDEFIQRWAMR